eukprot:788377_1
MSAMSIPVTDPRNLDISSASGTEDDELLQYSPSPEPFAAVSQFNSHELYDTYHHVLGGDDPDTEDYQTDDYDVQEDIKLEEGNEDSDLEMNETDSFWHTANWNNVHQTHMIHKTIPPRNHECGPNLMELKRRWENLASELKSAECKYRGSSVDVLKMTANQHTDRLKGYLTPSDLICVSFVGTKIFEWLAQNTNKRVTQKMRLGPAKKWHKNWHILTELNILFAILIHSKMGFQKRAGLKNYWRKGKKGDAEIKNVLVRDQFLLIWRQITTYDIDKWDAEHKEDDMDALRHDRMDNAFKGRELWFKWNEHPAKLYHRGLNISCDEYMIRCKGKTGVKRRIKTKKHSEGIKVHKLANTSGYAFEGEMDCKRLYYESNKAFPDAKLSKGAKILLFMLKKHRYKGHHVYSDSWYTQYWGILQSKDNYHCGTCRRNGRMLPHAALRIKENRPIEDKEFTLMSNSENAMFCLGGKNGSTHYYMWYNLPINPISAKLITKPNKKALKSIQKRKKRKPNTQQPKNLLLNIINAKYIENMNGVDLNNQRALAQSNNVKA